MKASINSPMELMMLNTVKTVDFAQKGRPKRHKSHTLCSYKSLNKRTNTIIQWKKEG